MPFDASLVSAANMADRRVFGVAVLPERVTEGVVGGPGKGEEERFRLFRVVTDEG